MQQHIHHECFVGDKEGWIDIDQDQLLTLRLSSNGEPVTFERIWSLLERAHEEGCKIVVQELHRTSTGRIMSKKVLEKEKLIHVGLAAFANAGDLYVTTQGQKSFLEKALAGIHGLSSICKVRFHWNNSAQKAGKSKPK